MVKKLFEEKTLSSKQIFQGKILNLRVDTVELPDGKQATREIIEHQGAVVVVAINRQGELVFVRQFRKPIEMPLLELPAGKIDYQEEPLACARRELEEETGYRAREWKKLLSFYTTPGFSNELLHLMIAKGLEKGEAHSDEEEFLEVVHLPMAKAKEMVLKGDIQDAKTIIGILACFLLGEY